MADMTPRQLLGKLTDVPVDARNRAVEMLDYHLYRIKL